MVLRCISQRTLPSLSVRCRRASSFVRGSEEVPLFNHTFPKFFNERLLSKHSAAAALISVHEPAGVHGGPMLTRTSTASYLRWSFEDLDRHVSALARGLLKLGVKSGDRVGVVMGNNRFTIFQPLKLLLRRLLKSVSISKCVRNITVGLRKNRRYHRDYKPGLQDVRNGNIRGLFGYFLSKTSTSD